MIEDQLTTLAIKIEKLGPDKVAEQGGLPVSLVRKFVRTPTAVTVGQHSKIKRAVAALEEA